MLPDEYEYAEFDRGFFKMLAAAVLICLLGFWIPLGIVIGVLVWWLT